MRDESEYVFAPGGSEWGTSDEFPLRPALSYRGGAVVITAVFVASLVHSVWTGLTDGWGSQVVISSVLQAVLSVVGAYLTVGIVTSRVWVEHSFEPGSTMYHQWTIHRTHFGHRSRARLRSPDANLRITGSAPFGPRPGWKLRVTNQGAPRQLVVGTPWQHDLSRLLELLHPVVSGDPGLVTDERTLEVWGLPRRTSRRPRPPA